MAVQRPSLDVALSNWQQRAQYYGQLGIHPNQWYQLALQDVSNVANTGASPMSTAEVNSAMLAQASGRSIIGNPTPHHHGLFGDIEGAITSVPHDIAGLLTGFLGGTARFVHHLPSETVNTGEYLAHASDPEWLQAHGYQDPTHEGFLSRFATDLRNMGKAPLLSVLPGIADIADVTTAQGRQFLDTHPVTAALDVAPLGRVIGGATRAVTAPAEAGTALEALQSGQVLRAGGRAISTGSAKAFGTAPDRTLQTRLNDVANTFGVSASAKEVFRSHTTIGRKYSREVQAFVSEMGQDLARMSPQEREQLWNENAGLAPITDPRHEAYIMRFRDLQDKLLRYGEERYRQTRGKDGLIVKRHGKGRLIFSATDPIVRSVRQLDRLHGYMKTVRRRHGQASRAVAKHQVVVDALRRRLEEDRAHGLPTNRLERELSDRVSKLQRAQVRLTDAEARRKRLQQMLLDTRRRYYQGLYEGGGTASLHPRVRHDIRQQLLTHRFSQYEMEKTSLAPLNDPNHPLYDPTSYQSQLTHSLQMLEDDIGTIKEAATFKQLKQAIVGPAERLGNDKALSYAKRMFDEIRNDVVRNVLDLVSRGYDPVWLKHVDPGREDLNLHVNPIPDHIMDITQFNRRVFNFSPQVHDLALGLISAAVELYRAKATEEFVIPLVKAWGRTSGDLFNDYIKIARMDVSEGRHLATHDITGHAQQLKDKEWEVIDANRFGLRSWRSTGRFSQTDEVNIPKWLALNLHKMTPRDPTTGVRHLPLMGSYDRVMHVFRFSVLTGPRHLVHVGLGGLVALMMREPFAPMHFARALKMIRHGTAPDDLVKHIYDFTDGLYSYAVGRQYGTWIKRAWDRTGQQLQTRLARIEETISDVYRVSSLLSSEARGFDREEAIARANKVAVDMDDMAPWERTIFKHVFPFYGFTRFLFRYLLTYPVDHPYRVAILSRFSTQEQEEWNSLIPQKFMQVLFLGQPDSHGNIKTIDYRNLNPFRSFSNDFTMVGFFQSLNPLLSMPFAVRGFDVLSGVGPLYPSLEFNPQSGTLQAAPPGGRDELFNALSQFIPEIGTVDHFFNITDRMRVLKRSNPAAYRSMLYSQLNLPGILSPPIDVNLPYVEERAEMDRYKAAQQAVSTGEKGQVPNAWSKAEQFQLVPYQGKYVDPNQLAAYWKSLEAQTGGIDPRALMAIPTRRTSQDPLELLQNIGQLPQSPSQVGY